MAPIDEGTSAGIAAEPNKQPAPATPSPDGVSGGARSVQRVAPDPTYPSPRVRSRLLLVAVLIFFMIFTRGKDFIFLSGTASWVNVAAQLGIVAVPIGLLLIAGEFDLSIGAMTGATSIFVAVAVTVGHWPFWLAVLAAMAMSVTVGLINATVLIKTRLPSFIVTLASWFVIAGLSLGITRTITGTTSVSLTVNGFAHDLFAGNIGQFNAAVIWWVAITLVAVWVLGHTRTGNWILGTGGNAAVVAPQASRRTGSRLASS